MWISNTQADFICDHLEIGFIKIALDLFLLNEKESSLVPGPKEVTKKTSAVPLAGKLNKFSSRGTSAGKLKNPLRFSTQVFRPIEFSLRLFSIVHKTGTGNEKRKKRGMSFSVKNQKMTGWQELSRKSSRKTVTGIGFDQTQGKKCFGSKGGLESAGAVRCLSFPVLCTIENSLTLGWVVWPSDLVGS